MKKKKKGRFAEQNYNRSTNLNACVAYTEDRAGTRIGNVDCGNVSILPLEIFLGIH